MGHRAAFRGADPSRKLPWRDGLSAALVAADYALAAATLVFLVTYVLISLRTVRRFPIERPAVAMLGGALMLVLGVLTPAQALLAINLDVIVLLVGMMLLVSGLEACGFFDLVSSRIAVRAKSQVSFLAGLMVAIGLVWLAFRKDLAPPLARAGSVEPVHLQRRGLVVTLGVTAGVAAAFFASPTPVWLPLVALAGGSFVLFFLPFFAKTTARTLIAKVDWSIILFFVGLVIVVQVASRDGVTVSMKDFVKAGLPVTAATLVLSTVLIALLVPA